MRKKRHKEEQEAQAAANAAMGGGGSPRTKGSKVITAVADTKLSGTTRSKRFTEA